MDSNKTHVYYTVNQEFIDIAAVSAYSYLKFNDTPVYIYLVNCENLDKAKSTFAFDSRIHYKTLKVDVPQKVIYHQHWYKYRNEILAKYYVLDLINQDYDYGMHIDADVFFKKDIDFEKIDMSGYDYAAVVNFDLFADIIPSFGLAIFKTESSSVVDDLLKFMQTYYSQRLSSVNTKLTTLCSHGSDEIFASVHYKSLKGISSDHANKDFDYLTTLCHMNGVFKPWAFNYNYISFLFTKENIISRINSLKTWYKYMHEIKDYLNPEFVKKSDQTSIIYQKLLERYTRNKY